MLRRDKTLSRTLKMSAACLALVVPSMAFAQEAPQTEDTSDTEIVVTAQGRSQVLSDVPVAISAVNAETLQNSGANDIRQLNQVAPSLLVSSTGSEANGSARIRGIGTVGDNPGLESSVPVFIDGVYRSRSGIGLNELGEIDRVEVQRGPQGTLGGRNSSAGLISIYSKKPSFTFGGSGELTYGNYDFMRGASSVTGPISEQLAFRVDGVYVKRDGFYRDDQNGRDINNRDRYFLRGQFLFEPTDALSVRLIADYTFRTEECCAATYVDQSVNQFIGNLNNVASPLTQPGTGGATGIPARPSDTGNNIINVLRDMGQPLAALSQGFGRNVSVSPNRVFSGETKDYGFSGQIDYDFGGATLTSITAYRQYRSGQASDTDYSEVDILYRALSDDAYRQFHTFTQELRLQGEAFDGKLDWLVGGFFANEKLTLRDNLRFGNQYGRFATCRIISGGGLADLYSPTNIGCVLPFAAPGVTGLQAVGGATGASGADIIAAFTRLDGLNDRGTTNDRYFQNGTNWAVFSHNILHITDTLDLTFGLRYTKDKKKFDATFGNDNTACTAVQGLLLDDLTQANLPTDSAVVLGQRATARALAGSLIGLSCQGNSTAELNGVSIRDQRDEDQITGTAILSWKPVDDLLVYGSFARGYKAGGFNLDRSALKSPIFPFGGQAGTQALVGKLQFDPELVDSYELGAKFSNGPFGLSVSAFRSDFSSFQLNTFNGTVFLVQNINGCNNLVGGSSADTDLSNTTGSCATGDITYGVRTQGVELEASLVPARNFRMAAGLTYAKTTYRDDLIGTKNGAPLDLALRKLPGDNLSNAPEFVATSSITWTPDIGRNGMSGLVYIDGRMTSDYNTGSDLFPQKEQDGFAVFNARIGLRGADEAWGIELWGQNIFNQDYAQVAFNSPFQAGTTAAPFVDPQYPGGRQIFSQFLAEPRTYGITLRGKF